MIPGCLPLGMYPWPKDLKCGPVIGSPEWNKESVMTVQESYWRHWAIVFGALWASETWADLARTGRTRRRRLHARARAVVVFDRCLNAGGTEGWDL